MAREPRPHSPTPVGASPTGAKKKGGRRRLIGLIVAAVIILALLALLLSRGGSDPDSSAAGASSSAASSMAGGSASSSARSSTTAGATRSTSAPTATATAPAAGTPGAVISTDGQSLIELAGFPDPATALATVTGQTVTGTAVAVLSVPADEGFWVGTSDTARIWVQLTGAGESAYQVTAGDLVAFTGTVVAHDGTFAGTVGLADADGAAQLTTQAQHVEVAKGAVTLSAG